MMYNCDTCMYSEVDVFDFPCSACHSFNRYLVGEPKDDDTKKEPDMVNHPPHYKTGSMECIDWLRACLSKEEFAGGLKMNVLKYMYRYKAKGGVQDLEKAKFYLNKLIEVEGA